MPASPFAKHLVWLLILLLQQRSFRTTHTPEFWRVVEEEALPNRGSVDGKLPSHAGGVVTGM